MPTLSTKPNSPQLPLEPDAPVVVTHARGLELRALTGIVWITEAGEACDVFLRAGESYRIRGQGLVVLEAVRDTARIEYQRTGFLPWLFGLILPGRVLARVFARNAFVIRQLGIYPANFSSSK